MKHLEFKSLLLTGVTLLSFACTSDESTSAPEPLICPIAELSCFHDSSSKYVVYGDAYLYTSPSANGMDLLIYKDSRIVTDAKGNPVGMLNSSGTAVIDNVTGEPIVQMLKLGELEIVTPFIPVPEEDPITSASGETETTYKLLYDIAWLLHADRDYLIYENGDVSDANCYKVGTITDHFNGDIIDNNGKMLVKGVNASELKVISVDDHEACPARAKSSSSNAPASSSSKTVSSSSKQPESSSSSGGGSTPTTGCPAIKTKGGGGSGWATRYCLISTSTPAGKSSFMRESTVCGVASRMSIRRLCVRDSNCSREVLSICGERSTVYFWTFVGRGMGPAMRAPVFLAVFTIS